MVNKFIAAISQYGFSHGLITAGVLAITWNMHWTIFVGSGVVAAYAYWDREYTARKKDGTPQLRHWYLDSQMDALVPVVVVLVGFWLRFA